MSLFSKLVRTKKEPQGPLDTELAAIAKDARMHARIRLQDLSLATLTLPTGLSGRVVDLSYGGIAAIFPSDGFPLRPSMQADATMALLGASCPLRMTMARVSTQGQAETLVAFSLHHELPEGLLFLRDFIEPARCGETLSLIVPEMRQARFQGNDWHCWRGQGPTDLIAHAQPGTAELLEAILTFRLNKSYCELTMKNGAVKTGVTQESDTASSLNSSPRMVSAENQEIHILRTAITILISSPLLCRLLTAPMAALARAQLSLLTGASVQAKQA